MTTPLFSPDLAAEITAGRGLSLFEAAQRLPPRREGVPVTARTVRRWVEDGIDIGGQRVRLAAVRLAGRWLTSGGALSEFVARQTELELAGAAR